MQWRVAVYRTVAGAAVMAVTCSFAARAGADSIVVSTAQALCKAYSGLLSYDASANEIVWSDGFRVPFGTDRPELTFEQRIDSATPWDQLSVPYPREWPASAPAVNADPGRLRCDAFFKKVYGDTAAAVESNLVRVAWPPSGDGKSVRFTKVNGAHKALEAVGAELAELPEAMRRYVAKPNGTFNWRPIAGAGRLSPHSYGIAIDFAMPIDNQYWRWDGKNGGTPETSAAPDDIDYPIAVLRDENLRKIVETFERHGFIWGGKWRHYDLMHFEYRPELTQ